MTRSLALPAARHFRPGTPRANEPGATLRCLVLAPGPDWVAVDIASGALVRRFAPLAANGGAAANGAPAADAPGADRPELLGAPLSAVEIVLAAPDEPRDPARPEAVRLAGPPKVLPAPRRRAVRHLLGHLVENAPAQPLLGTLGPSIAYVDLDGWRPSVAVVEPDRLPRFGNGPTGPWCQFVLGGRRHALPLLGRPDAVFMGDSDWDQPLSRKAHSGPSRRKRAKAMAAVGAQMPRWLVVAFGAPRRGQVPKVVLAALSDPSRR